VQLVNHRGGQRSYVALDLASGSVHNRPAAGHRHRSMLGHLTLSMAANPLSNGAPPRKHPRMLPDGTREAMLDAVRTARDRMIVTWLSDSGMRIGELCGLWFCDLHLRNDHPCGERKGPHAHVVKRLNPNRASANTGFPAMVASYHEYLAEDYHRVRALAPTDLVLVQLVGERTGDALSTHGARQMIERAGRRAGLGLIKPHAFRHTWATAHRGDEWQHQGRRRRGRVEERSDSGDDLRTPGRRSGVGDGAE